MIVGNRLFGRRFIALAAAYAIALSSLVAAFTAARAAATSGPDVTICHRDVAAEPEPASDHGSGKVCVDGCCIGCLVLAAAVPPPPKEAAPPSTGPGQILQAALIPSLAIRPEAKFHQSRAPPLPA